MTEPQFRHVLVPLDGSELADGAMPVATALADRFATELGTISVVEDRGDVEKLRRHATRALGGWRGAADRVSVVVNDDVPAVVARRAADLAPCLLCLSTRGHGRFAGAVLGSVTRSLLQSTREPLIAVGPYAGRPRETAPKPPGPLPVPRLVACVDGGPASERVLPVAVAWAEALDLSLTILTVAEPSLPPSALAPRGDGPMVPTATPRPMSNAWPTSGATERSPSTHT